MSVQNKLISGLSYAFGIRYLSVDVTEIAQTAQFKHKLTPTRAKLCAEGIIAATLMSSQIKGEERISLHMQLEEPSASFMCDVTAQGCIRARFRSEEISQQLIKGIILVIKHNASRELYRGVTEVNHSSLEAALLNHLQNSTQVPSALRCEVKQDEQGKIIRAVGILFELLPKSKDFDELTPEDFKTHVSTLHELSFDEFVCGLDESKLLGKDLHAMKELKLSWQCHCSKQRAESLLFSLGKAELEDMLKENKDQEIICEFCNTHYLFSPEKIQALIAEHA